MRAEVMRKMRLLADRKAAAPVSTTASVKARPAFVMR